MIGARRLSLPAALTLVAAGSPLAAQQTVPPLGYSTFALDNGIQFVVAEDHSTPVVAVNVYYDVGSAHDPPGRTGFAHLFEHLLFQETADLGKGEMGRLFTRAGATWDATTSQDRTAYFEALPSNRLNLALWIEAERMARLKVTEENFRREREVVKEERRLRRENQPYGESYERLDLLTTDYAPYDRVNSMEDLDAATVADVRDFYKKYYNPNSATIVVAGDVTAAQVRELAERYFAGIPRGPEIPPLPPPTPTPRATGERRLTLDSKLATIPRLYIAYDIPPLRHEDNYALTLLSRIAGGGESSRLYQRLVQREQVSAEIGSIVVGRRGPGFLVVVARPNQGVPIDRLEALINDEIRRLQTQGVTPRELQKAKNQLRAETVLKRQGVFSKTFELQEARLMYGAVGAVNTVLDKYMAVTVEDIARAARRYLVAENRAVVVTVPARGAAGQVEAK